MGRQVGAGRLERRAVRDELARPLARALPERSDDDEVARRSATVAERPAEPLGELAQHPGLVGVAEEQRLRAPALEDEGRPAVQAFGAHPADPNGRRASRT